MLPFTHDQFLAVFASYNVAIWPAQAVVYGLGPAAVALVFALQDWGEPGGCPNLAMMGLWTGVAYHI